MQKRDHHKEIISVIKANGEAELFDESKIRNSLIRSGASRDIIDHVISNIKAKVHQNISTKKLYRIVFSELKKLHRPTAGKYHLKRAIMELGPTGFPFERFVAEIFRAQAYQIRAGVFIEGHCVKHEVDVIAEKGTEQLMMECKFHSDPGIVCDVKHAMYVRARFWDIEKKLKAIDLDSGKSFKAFLVTNTRMTSDAERYGVCSGLALMSWNFPKGKSLRELIDDTGLHPVTCITSLTRNEKSHLLNQNIVLCRSLCNEPGILREIGITEMRIQKIIEEGMTICKSKKTVL